MSIKKCFVFLILNLISFNCINAQNTKGVKVTKINEGDSGKTWAVIIGISKYQNIEDLNFADVDAKLFYNYLCSEAGGNLEPAQIKLLTNEDASIGNIFSAFEWLKDNAETNDKAIIYYSGHGDVETLTDAQNGFLLTYNTPKTVYIAGAFPVYLLENYINTLSNKNIHVTLIADACRSGKLAGGEGGAQQTGMVLQQQWNNEVKILSCQPGELSLESNIGGGRGVFSYYLINGLTGLADLNKDNKVSLTELNIYLSTKVPVEANPLPQNPLVRGNMMQVISYVNNNALLELQANIGQENALLTTIASKGIEDKYLDDKPNWKEKYLLFEKYLKEENSYRKEGESAYSIYREFEQANFDEKLVLTMKRNLMAALQNEAQEVINRYLSGAMALDTVTSELEQLFFGPAADKLRICNELFPAEHPFKNSLLARQLFLEARMQRFSKNDSILWKAIEKLNHSIELEPNAAYSFNTRGIIYHTLKQYDQSISDYEKASQMAPKWGYPIYNIGRVYEGQKIYNLAIKFYDKALEIDSAYTYAYISKGNVYYIMRDYEKAQQLFNIALNIDSNSKYAYNGLGAVSYMLKNHDSALIYYKKAIEIDSSFKDGFNNIGNIYNDYKDYEKAVIFYKKAIEIDSLYTSAYNGLGNIYYNLKDYDKAIICYNKAIAIDSTYRDPLINIGNLYKVLKEYDKAITYYNKTISVDSLYAKPYNNLGSLYNDLKEYDKAIKNYKKAIKIDSLYTSAYNGLGNVFYNLKDYDDAIHYYKKAIEIDTSYREAYYNMGLIYSNLKDYENAINYYKKAIQVDSTYTVAYKQLASILENNFEDFNGAIDYYKKVIEIDSTYSIAYTNIASILRYNLNDYETAADYYKKAIEVDSTYRSGYYSLGTLYTDLHDYSNAITYFTNVTQDKPNFITGYTKLGDLFYKVKNYEKAIATYKSIIQLDSTKASTYEKIANAYYGKYKNHKHSVYYLEKALNYNPRLIEVYKNLIDFFIEENNHLLAIEYCNKLLDAKLDDKYCYEQLAGIYKELGNDEEYNSYMRKYNEYKKR